MGSNISKADKALLQKLASKYGFSLVSASETSPVMPEIAPAPKVSIIEKLVADGKLVALSGYRTVDKDGFTALRNFAVANGLKINTSSVIISLTQE